MRFGGEGGRQEADNSTASGISWPGREEQNKIPASSEEAERRGSDSRLMGLPRVDAGDTLKTQELLM